MMIDKIINYIMIAYIPKISDKMELCFIIIHIPIINNNMEICFMIVHNHMIVYILMMINKTRQHYFCDYVHTINIISKAMIYYMIVYIPWWLIKRIYVLWYCTLLYSINYCIHIFVKINMLVLYTWLLIKQEYIMWTYTFLW